jgi:hypothetical protein
LFIVNPFRNLRRHWPGTALSVVTLSTTWAVLLHLGLLFHSYEERGTGSSGKRTVIVRESLPNQASARGLAAATSAALEGIGGTEGEPVHRLIRDDLMRFNLTTNGTSVTKFVGAADTRALQLMGATLDGGSFWRSEDAGLLALIARSAAVEMFGGSEAAIGKTFEIQGRLFTVSGVLDRLPATFEDVAVWTNQADNVAALFNNGLPLAPSAFALIEWPRFKSDAVLDQQLKARAESLAQASPVPYRGMSLLRQNLSEYLADQSIRLNRALWQTVALALLSAAISVWLLLSVRSLRASRDNRIRMFLGLQRRSIYWEAASEQLLVALTALMFLGVGIATAPAMGFGEPLEVTKIPDLFDPRGPNWIWGWSILLVPALNVLASLLIQWMLLNAGRNRFMRVEPLIACHAASTIALWMLVSLFAQDVAAGWAQSQTLPNHLYTAMLTMPGAGEANQVGAAPVHVFSRELSERIRRRGFNAQIGFSTWLPFLDSSFTEFLRRPSEAPVSGIEDHRVVDKIACTHGFLASFRPRLIAGSLPTEKNTRDNWIVLDRTAAQRHFADLSMAVGADVMLLGGNHRVAAVIEPFAFRGKDTARQPQVFVNFDREERLLPYLSVSLAVPDAPALAPAILRDEVKSLDPRISPFRIESVRSMIEEATEPNRTAIRWLTILIVGVALAMGLGIASMSRSILESRRGDFATMLALGAGKRAVVRFAFSRLGLYCLAGLLIGAWAGLHSCLRFADQITVDPKFISFGALQAAFSILLLGVIGTLPSVYRLFCAPLAEMLKERSGAAIHIPGEQL